MIKHTKESLEEAVKNSTSYSGVMHFLKLEASGSRWYWIKSKISRFNIDTSHFTPTKRPNNIKNKLHYNDVLVYVTANKRTNSKILRRALIESGIKYECSECSLPDIWHNKKLILEIHHIDGKWRNNTKENLRFLCPNCHNVEENAKRTKTPSKMTYTYCICGQRKAYSSKLCVICANQKRRNHIPNIDELKNQIWNMPISHIAKIYNVTDNTIHAWCEGYNLDKPPKGYWLKTENKNYTYSGANQ